MISNKKKFNLNLDLDLTIKLKTFFEYIWNEILKLDEYKNLNLSIDEIENKFTVEEPPKNIEADFASNICFIGAKLLKTSPIKIAEKIINFINNTSEIKNMAETEFGIKNIFIAGNGFLNFTFKELVFVEILLEFVKNKELYFFTDKPTKKVLLEFVSANPTGPLHIGHARGAVIGDSLARLLKKKGYSVFKEYYVNNAGNQIEVLAKSLEIRYRQIAGENISFPENHYQGDYILEIAKKLYKKENQKKYFDDINFKKIVLYEILQIIENDLKKFNIEFDNWFLETNLLEKNDIDKSALDDILDILNEKGFIKEIDGALWLNTVDMNYDDKDRVLIRNDGRPTYFANDIAYHKNKFDRNYDCLIDIWGADHHGYVPRLKASMNYLGFKKEDLYIILYQLVSLVRNGEKIAMSTRTGEFISLTEVIDEVGVDATRFFLLMRDGNSPLDFDLELAKKQSNENPVYYIQYAHARIKSIINNAKQNNISIDNKDINFYTNFKKCLGTKEDISIIKTILNYRIILEHCIKDLSTHHIAIYLLDLAGKFHNYYNKYKIIDKQNIDLSKMRLLLCNEVAFIIKNGLEILGVSAPDSM
ncbi:MAG: arginine--tRNA ligase [Elusimicrobiota bacterium]|nr:arginine--tRNA ligase [Elusimicrobiota bacterium]